MKDEDDGGVDDALNKFVEVKYRKKGKEKKRRTEESASESTGRQTYCDCSRDSLANSSPIKQVPQKIKPKQTSKKQKGIQLSQNRSAVNNLREILVQRGEEEKSKKVDIRKETSEISKPEVETLPKTTALKPSEVTEASTVKQPVYSTREVPPRFSHRPQKMQAQQGQRKTSDWLAGSIWTSSSRTDTLNISADNQDIGTWQNPEGAWGTTPSSASANDIIVDTHDKEAWPSIGDQSETASDTGDTDSASVKTSSVISSSSNPGQTQVDSVLQSSSAIHGQSASSVWGSTSFTTDPSDEKIDSGAWGSSPGSASQINARGWDDNHPVSSVNNQGLMQSGQSIVSGGDNTSNTLNNRIPGVNWGANNSAVGNNNGQTNAMSGQEHGVSSSGALTVNNGPSLTDSQSGSNNAMSWQGINFSSTGLPGLQKDQAANSASAWGNVSVGNSVIGSGLGISTSTAGSYSTDSSKSMDQWGSSQNSSSSLGWNTPSSASQPEPSGWGSPCPSPNPGAGTEAWGAPENKSNPPQAWGQPNSKANNAPAGWGQPDAKTNPSSSAGWGDLASDSSSNSGSGWGQPPSKPSPSPWGQQSQSNQAQWGGAAANPAPAPASQWSAGASGANVAPTGSQGAWGGSAPVGSKPPAPPNQQSQPTSWAQAAGRGLYAQQNKPPTPVSTTSQAPDPKECYIAQVVNSHDGWGKRPIRQDTSWELEESPKLRRRNSNTEIENPSSHWDNNKGTAIWEASKGSSAPPAPPQWDNGNNRGASGGSDWGRDNDSGHWNGPPGDNSSNQWNGPQPTNQWGGGSSNWGDRRDGSGDRTTGRDSSHWGGGSSSSNSWDSNKSDNTWGSKEDNVWDRNGTNAWGSNSKVETGMWGGSRPRRGSSSSWGDESIEPMGWEDPDGHVGPPSGHQRQNSGGSVDDGTAFWGDPNAHRASNWNSQPSTPGVGPPRGPPAPDDKIGMWGGPVNSKPSSSWGDQKVDEGPFWSQSQPPQNKGWGDNQWNGVKPKTPSGSWGEPPDWGQQGGRRMGDAGGWGDDGASSVIDNTDMGNWEGSQDSTTSWTSAPRDWNKTQIRRNKGPPFIPGNGRQQPQMRSKLLQQLTEMGFKREDAQNALISNNMNMESAIADLIQSSKPRHDFDMDGKRKIQGIQPDGIPDTQSDVSQFVPPVSNTPFAGNAQSQLANSQVIANPLKAGVPSLQNPSSLSGLGQSSSISPSLQQKILQHQMAQQQLGGLPQQGQPIRGQMSTQSMQQQLMQQTVQQLRMAIQAGLISPKLLNQELTPNLRVMLHQLLQFLETHKQLVAQQQLLQQHLIQQKQQNPVMAHQLERQLEQVTLTVQHIKQQMARLQQQMAGAQTALLKQVSGADAQAALSKQVPGGSDAAIKADLLKDLTNNMSSLNLSNKEPYPQQPSQAQSTQAQQSGSRLTQWKLPSPDKEPGVDLNKAPGSKPLSAAHSAPNLQNKLETSVPSSLPFSDSTWSTLTNTNTSTGSWPSTSAISSTASSTTTASQDGSLPKESPDALDTSTANTSVARDIAITTSVSTTAPSSASPGGTTNQSGININDMIEEFVPGKRWQGIAIKSVEDDPYATPGSIQRPSLSVNTIKDDYVMTTLGKSTSPTSSESALGSTWGTSLGGLGKTAVVGAGTRSSWSSSSSSLTEQSLGSELWGIPQGAKNTRPPPGLTNQKQASSSWQSGGGSFNRSVSWAPGDRSFSTMGNAWSGVQQGASNCLLLKNLTPQIDGSTLRTLCQQHGPLQAFYLNLGYGQAIVRYGAKDEAAKAQMSLNSCVLGNTTIIAEFVSDADAGRLMEQLNAPGSSGGSMQQQQTGLMRTTSEAGGSYSTGSGGKDSSQWNGASTVWSSGGIGSGGGVGASSLWDGTPGLDEHNSLLPGDLLSGQSM